MGTEVIKVPDLGDSGDVEVIELLVSVGQSVDENDSLIVIERNNSPYRKEIKIKIAYIGAIRYRVFR